MPLKIAIESIRKASSAFWLQFNFIRKALEGTMNTGEGDVVAQSAMKKNSRKVMNETEWNDFCQKKFLLFSIAFYLQY